MQSEKVFSSVQNVNGDFEGYGYVALERDSGGYKLVKEVPDRRS